MKVVGVVGGPRKAGNTAALVEAVLEGARGKGHETEIIRLAELEVGHLVEKNGRVVSPGDDLDGVMRAVESAGAIVVGAPIWYGAWDSRTIAFLDRFYKHDDRKATFRGKKLVNCITYAWDKENAYDEVLRWAEGMEEYIGFTVAGSVAAEGTGSKPVAGRGDLLAEARRLGASL